MMDDRWHETERGTVVRNYFHLTGAAREMQLAQQEGWNVQEVRLNGTAVPLTEQKGRFRRPLLVKDSDGTVRLRAPRSAHVWDHGHRMGKGLNVEVTYVRN